MSHFFAPHRFTRLAPFLVFLAAIGCNQAPAAKEKKAVEVTVTTPISADVVDYEDFTGRMDAVKMVEIRARVSGYLEKTYVVGSRDRDDVKEENSIREGDLVEKGTLLFLVDPRPYKAALDAAEAQVNLGEANVKLADITYRRAQDAANRGFGAVSLLELDQDLAQQELARANLKAAQATLYNARLDYDWCRVTAPVSGRISRRFIDPGNIVSKDQTLLTTIVTEDPLYAYFDVDERTFLDLEKTYKPHTSQGPEVAMLTFRVLMRLANEEEFTHVGQVNFLDNRINANTGTIRMRGEFANQTRSLKPGLFARIRLPLGKPYPALLISDEAVQSDQGNHFVYVVNRVGDTETVAYRPVQLGQAIEGLRDQARAQGQGGQGGPATRRPGDHRRYAAGAS